MKLQTIKVVIYCYLPTVIWWKSGAQAFLPPPWIGLNSEGCQGVNDNVAKPNSNYKHTPNSMKDFLSHKFDISVGELWQSSGSICITINFRMI